MVHRRQVEETELVLGNQGALYGDAMTWWDHGTGSIWSQPRGEAILGPLRGKRLDLLPSSLTTWQAWQDAHPETLALDVLGWRTGFHLEDMAIVVDLGDEAVAYRVPALRDAGVVNDVVAGIAIAVVIDPDDETRWAVFGRQVDDRVVDLEVTADGLVDRTSQSTFEPFLGIGRAGPLADQSLPRLAGFTAFPEDFETFFPGARIWGE